VERWLKEEMPKHQLKEDVGPEKWTVSTVFLGLDHSFEPDGPPVLWETMVFGGPEGDFQCRYATAVEARAGHAAKVAELKALAEKSDDQET